MIWMSGEFCDVLPPKDSVLTARKGLSVAAAEEVGMLGRAEPSFPWQTNLRRPCVAEHAEEASTCTPRLMRVVFDRFKTTTAAATGFVLTLLISTVSLHVL